jgi:hypothetical protein
MISEVFGDDIGEILEFVVPNMLKIAEVTSSFLSLTHSSSLELYLGHPGHHGVILDQPLGGRVRTHPAREARRPVYVVFII